MASKNRIALYVFFESIERDLIEHIKSVSDQVSGDFLNEKERMLAVGRLSKKDTSSDLDLLHGLDISQKYEVLLRLKKYFSDYKRKYFLQNSSKFSQAIKVRNATMHARPLTTAEYEIGFELANSFLKKKKLWPNLVMAFSEFQTDPITFVSDSINLLEENISGEVLHNLPEPDYLDTGFFPRPELESELKQKVLGRYPVITILGQGGNGKTALALQVLYDLVVENDHDFDAIVWVTAKSNRLGSSEVERINGSITSSLGVLNSVADFLIGETESPLEKLRQHLQQNKILLVIDNLETILDETIIGLATDVPGQSKLIFTSRVPLGGDLSVKVGEFSEQNSIRFLRTLANAYDVTRLKKCDNEILQKYARKLNNKPLLLKWFVLGVVTGAEPEAIVTNPEMAVSFCMENVFENISANSRNLICVLAVLPREVSALVLQFVTDFNASEIEEAISILNRFGLIDGVHNSNGERVYSVNPFVRSYLVEVLKPGVDHQKEILSRFRSIEYAYQTEKGLLIQNKYRFDCYVVRTSSEALAALQLKKAVRFSQEGKFLECNQIISDLKISNVGYFEVKRIEAMCAMFQGDFVRSKSSYEIAIEMAPEEPQLYYFYGLFLLKHYGDNTGALEQFSKSLELNANSIEVARDIIRTKLYVYDFPAAQVLLDKATAIDDKTLRDEVSLIDLQIQIFFREVEFIVSAGDYLRLVSPLQSLYGYLASLDNRHMDRKLHTLLRKMIRVFSKLRRTVSDLETVKILEDIEVSIFHKSISQATNRREPKHELDKLIGRGLGKFNDKYIFLQDTSNISTYLPRGKITDSNWNKIIKGSFLEYDVKRKVDGRFFATNIRFLER